MYEVSRKQDTKINSSNRTFDKQDRKAKDDWKVWEQGVTKNGGKFTTQPKAYLFYGA